MAQVAAARSRLPMVAAAGAVLAEVPVVGQVNTLEAPAAIMAAAGVVADMVTLAALASPVPFALYGLAARAALHRSRQPTSDLNLEHGHGTR